MKVVEWNTWYGEALFTSLEDFLGWKPVNQSFHGVGWERVENITITVIHDGGKTTQLEVGFHAQYAANHVADVLQEPPSIWEQIMKAGIDENLQGIIYSWSNDNEDGHDEGSVYIPIAPIDWKKVRRRLEDLIRKNEKAMRRLAMLSGVNIW